MVTVKARYRQSVAVRHFDGAKSRLMRTARPSGRGGHVSAIDRLKIRLNFIWFAAWSFHAHMNSLMMGWGAWGWVSRGEGAGLEFDWV
jgi:hypothetical protein